MTFPRLSGLFGEMCHHQCGQSPGRSGLAKGQLPSGAKVPGHGEQWVWGREGSRCPEKGSEDAPVEWAPPSPHPLPKPGSLSPGLTRLGMKWELLCPAFLWFFYAAAWAAWVAGCWWMK